MAELIASMEVAVEPADPRRRRDQNSRSGKRAASVSPDGAVPRKIIRPSVGHGEGSSTPESHKVNEKASSTGPVQPGLSRITNATNVGSPGGISSRRGILDDPASGGTTPRSDYAGSDREGTAVALSGARDGRHETDNPIETMLWNLTNSAIDLSTLAFSKQQAESREKRSRAQHERSSRHFGDFPAIKEQQNAQLQSAQTQLKRTTNDYNAGMATHRKIIGEFSGLLHDMNAQARLVRANQLDHSASPTELKALQARLSALKNAPNSRQDEEEVRARLAKVESQQETILGLRQTIDTLESALKEAQQMTARAMTNQGQISKCQSEQDRIAKDIQSIRARLDQLQEDVRPPGKVEQSVLAGMERRLSDLDKSHEWTTATVRRLEDASSNTKGTNDLLKRLSAVEHEIGLGTKQPNTKNLATEISTVVNLTQGLLRDVEGLNSQVFDDAKGSLQTRLRKQDQLINNLASQVLPEGKPKLLTRLDEQGKGLVALRDEVKALESLGPRPIGPRSSTTAGSFDVSAVFANERFRKVEDFVEHFFAEDGIQYKLEDDISSTVLDHVDDQISKRQEEVRAYVNEVKANIQQEVAASQEQDKRALADALARIQAIERIVKELPAGRGGQVADVASEAITTAVRQISTSQVDAATTRFENEIKAAKDRLALVEQARDEVAALKRSIVTVNTSLDTVKASLQSKADTTYVTEAVEAMQKRIIQINETQIARTPTPGTHQAPGNRLPNGRPNSPALQNGVHVQVGVASPRASVSGSPSAEFTRLAQRVDTLQHATASLERRWDNLTTDEVVKQMLDRLGEIWPYAKSFDASIRAMKEQIQSFRTTLAKVLEQAEAAVVSAHSAETVAEMCQAKLQENGEEAKRMREEDKATIVRSIREIRVQGEEVSKRLAKVESCQMEMESRLREDGEVD